ncbi:MAG: excisionase family DNA-binding protein [Deltaproteobacteria bacterium]|nr:excisionase family DNA-binding protein [Deltaproteobacteria bacterium]MBI3294037.1 excisionase family DNA-binding protein [Deltaproteobacteria bacterium]
MSRRHIYQLISENRIPYSKVGRLVRFSPARIQEWPYKGGTR